MCYPAQLAPSHCRGDELPPVPPQQGPPVLRSRTLPAPHSCTGSAGPARPRGQRGAAEHPGSPAGAKPAGNRPAGLPRHLRGIGAPACDVTGETEAQRRHMFQDGLAGVTVFVGAMGAARQVVLDPHSPPQDPTPWGCLVPTRPPEPGVSPCPTGSGAASPAPRAGKRCGASHPNSPKPQRSGERSHPAPGARKHFQLWGHPTLTFPHLSDPFRSLGMGAGTSPRSGSCPAAREPLTAAPPAEGLERSFSRVCQGERLPTPAWEEIPPPSRGTGTAPSD